MVSFPNKEFFPYVTKTLPNPYEIRVGVEVKVMFISVFSEARIIGRFNGEGVIKG